MLVALCPRLASAQEAPPVPLGVAFSQESGEPIAMRVRDAGFVVRAGDGSWRLMCAGVLKVSGSSSFYVRGLAGDRLLVSHFEGLDRGSVDHCNWSAADPGLEGRNVVFVDDLGGEGDSLYALSTSDNVYTLHRSEDGGQSFEALPPLPDQGLAYFSVRVAPSDPNRIYVATVSFDVDSGVTQRLLSRSDDGGQSYQQWAIEADSDGSMQLLAVDPEDPDRLYMALTQGFSSHSHGEEMAAPRDQLFASDDGGETWMVMSDVELLGGFALGPAAGEIWLGDMEGGLYRSTDSGATFSDVDADMRVSCLQRRGPRVWVCGDSARDKDAFSLGYTDDAGASFVSVMRFDEVVGVLECDGAAVRVCDAPWSGWMFWNNIAMDAAGEPDAGGPALGHGDGTLGSGQMDGGPGADAAANDGGGNPQGEAARDEGGCSCRAVGEGGAGSGALMLGTSLLLLRRRRRRTRR